MRRFTKVFSAMFAVIMLFTGLPQASGVEEQTADPKIPLSSSGEPLDTGMSEDETMTEPSEHIYDLSLSKSRIYLLPGMSFRLTVSAVTEPFDPQPELSTESTAPTEETTAAPALETTAPVTDETVTEETTLPAETELNDDPVMPQLSEIEITESEATETTVEKATADAPTEETIAEETTTEPTTAEETTADIVTEPETTEAEKPIEAITPIPVGEDDNESYIWRSNDESVATVSPDGVVTAVSLGMAVVTASTVDGSCTAVCEVMVVNELPNGNENSNSVMATNYATPHTAITIDWVNQYTSPESETAARTISPGTMLKLIRKEGNFYVAHTLDSTTNYYMWAANIFDRHAGNGYIEICKVNTSDTRRHWDMYTTQSLRLAVRTGGTATWASSNANIATISSNGTITPLAAGTTYITATQNGKKDVIHLTVITKYSSTLDGVVKPSWCSEYRCSHSSCTVYNRKVSDCRPENRVYLYGESAGYYYARVYGESNYVYMWKSNIDVPRTWLRKKELNNILNMEQDIKYYPQGFAVDNGYCYSFEVANKYDLDGKDNRIASEKNDDDIYHRLFRYSMSSGELVQMQPVGTIGHLWHANDAAIVNFSDGKYIFVAAFSTRSQNYIVKLKINDSSNTYQEVARYTLSEGNMSISAITVLESNETDFVRFLIVGNDSYYHINVSKNQSVTTPLVVESQGIVPVEYDETRSKLTAQGIHYDTVTDKLYRPLTSSNNAKESDVYVYKLNYNSASNTSNPSRKDHWNIDRVSGDNTFEIESVGFMPGSDQIWFNVFEGDLLNSEICVDHKKK